MIVDNFPDRIISIKGKSYLYFGGTSYLGMATHNRFLKLVTEGIKKWGAFYGSSRNANVKLSVYESSEALLAKWINAEDTVTTSSGAIAGKLVLDYLSKTTDTFFHYPKTHPAIVANNSLPLFLNDHLHPKILDDEKEELVISVDAILALEVIETSFDFLETIPLHKTITLLIDESHSMGLLGPFGGGVFSSIPSNKIKQKIMVASMGKALSIPGGIIGGKKEITDEIKKESTFVSSSGANTAYLHAFIEGQSIYRAQQKKLKSNMAFLFSILDKCITEIQNETYPVLYFQKKGIYQNLLKEGIIITSFKYPSYDIPMNRIVITANHTQEDLKVLAIALNKIA